MATTEMIDLVCDGVIVEKDYMPLPSVSLSEKDWNMDASDYLLNLDNDDMADLRDRLRNLLWWDKYMMPGNDVARHVDFAGAMANDSMRIASLLLKSLAASNITIEMLKVDE